MINRTLKKRWISALRSGKFRQGRGVLHRSDNRGDRYCCMGILCVLGNVEVTSRSDDVVQYGYHQDFPPSSIGLGRDDADILAEANDDARWTFAEIADWIELFVEAKS